MVIHDITNICSAWFLDIRISTCLHLRCFGLDITVSVLLYLYTTHCAITMVTLQMKIAGQPEININNDAELLDHAIELRKRNFFRVLFMQLL